MNILYFDVPMFECVFAIIALVYILWTIKHFLNRNNYWRQFGIDGPWGLPFLGIMGRQLFSNGVDNEIKWLKEYGKVYGTIGYSGKPLLVVGEPNLIKQITVRDFHVFPNRPTFKSIPEHEIIIKNLFQSEDDNWRRLRAIVSPSFTSSKLKNMKQSINNCIEFCLENLEQHARDKKEADLKDVFGCFTMDVIAKCAFGVDTDANKDPNNPFVYNARNILNVNLLSLVILLTPKMILNWLDIKTIRPIRYTNYLLDISRAIIKHRRANNIQQNDLIQSLMDNQIGDSEEKTCDKLNELNENEDEIRAQEKIAAKLRVTDKKLTEDEIVAQSYMFFLVGFETTTLALSLIAYELAVNPDVQERLYREIKFTAKCDGQIDYDSLAQLPYLNAVVWETLRKYPPIYVDRRVDEKYQLGYNGIVLNPGDCVQIPIYAIHHCQEFHPDPERFKPERFLPENRHLIKPYTFLPFGAGPRQCVGMRLALFEIKMIVAQLVQKFWFVPSVNTDIPLKHYNRMIFLGIKRIKVDVRKR